MEQMVPGRSDPQPSDSYLSCLYRFTDSPHPNVPRQSRALRIPAISGSPSLLHAGTSFTITDLHPCKMLGKTPGVSVHTSFPHTQSWRSHHPQFLNRVAICSVQQPGPREALHSCTDSPDSGPSLPSCLSRSRQTSPPNCMSDHHILCLRTLQCSLPISLRS